MKLPVALLLLALPAHAATLAGLWEFEDTADLGKATIGSALTFTGTVAPTTGTGGEGAADFAKGAWISATNPVGANGATGAPTRTNQYTIVLDFQVPSFTDGGDDGTFTALFDFDNGGSDADFFIRKQTGVAELGVGTQWVYVGTGPTANGSGTTGTVLSSTWYRLVLTADTGVGRSVYLNGSLIGNYAAGTQDAARQSLSTTTPFRVLWDNNAETSRTLISTLAIFDGRLNATEVADLGGAGTQVPEPSVLGLAGLAALTAFRRRR